MTVTILHARQSEHMTAVNTMNKRNALVKHILSKHPTETDRPTFEMRLISSHRSNLDRCITEGLLIEKVGMENRINCKTEWSKMRGLIRLTADRG